MIIQKKNFMKCSIKLGLNKKAIQLLINNLVEDCLDILPLTIHLVSNLVADYLDLRKISWQN